MALTEKQRRAQSMKALEEANRVRFLGSEIRARLHKGELTLKEVFEMEEARVLRLGYVLRAQRRWGPRRVDKLLHRLDMDNSGKTLQRAIGDLTKREKRLILYGIEHKDHWVVSPAQLVPDE